MTKKIVHYIGTPVKTGDSRYLVQPVDHPDRLRVSNRSIVRTSRIEKDMDESGTFETQNSIYMKQVDD